jgi:hypothetical protein
MDKPILRIVEHPDFDTKGDLSDKTKRLTESEMDQTLIKIWEHKTIHKKVVEINASNFMDLKYGSNPTNYYPSGYGIMVIPEIPGKRIQYTVAHPIIRTNGIHPYLDQDSSGNTIPLPLFGEHQVLYTNAQISVYGGWVEGGAYAFPGIFGNESEKINLFGYGFCKKLAFTPTEYPNDFALWEGGLGVEDVGPADLGIPGAVFIAMGIDGTLQGGAAITKENYHLVQINPDFKAWVTIYYSIID